MQNYAEMTGIKNSLFFFSQFEKDFIVHQETQALLQKKEERINELEAELQAFKSQVSDGSCECMKCCF